MRMIDLTRSIDNAMPGVEITTAKELLEDGWNATNLSLYSHCGTHMDAPRHFLSAGRTIDRQPLEPLIGPATVVNLAPAKPRQLITVDDLGSAREAIRPGGRLLLRTDWSQRYGSDEYRRDLPRLSIELARWLVTREVALVGVEPPSVADVYNREEVTEVHQTLLRGDVVIVEGLVNLNQIRSPTVQLIVLPLKVRDGDGAPVRAVAMELAAGAKP